MNLSLMKETCRFSCAYRKSVSPPHPALVQTQINISHTHESTCLSTVSCVSLSHSLSLTHTNTHTHLHTLTHVHEHTSNDLLLSRSFLSILRVYQVSFCSGTNAFETHTHTHTTPHTCALVHLRHTCDDALFLN